MNLATLTSGLQQLASNGEELRFSLVLDGLPGNIVGTLLFWPEATWQLKIGTYQIATTAAMTEATALTQEKSLPKLMAGVSRSIKETLVPMGLLRSMAETRHGISASSEPR